jgi:hypothetical protein
MTKDTEHPKVYFQLTHYIPVYAIMHKALRLGYDVLQAFNSYTATHKRSNCPPPFFCTGLLSLYIPLTAAKAIHNVYVWTKAGNFALKIFV